MKKLFFIFAALLLSVSALAQRPSWNGGGLYFGDTIVLGDFYDMNSARSNHFAIDAFGVVVPLAPSGIVDFRANLRYTYDNLFFKDKMTLVSGINGVPVATPLLGDGIKKSKLRFHTVSLPVGFAVNPGKVSIGALIAPGLVFGASTKYKAPKTKGEVSRYNQFSLRLEGVVSYDGYGVYVNYGFQPLFEAGIYGDNARLLTIGAVFGF